MCERGYDETEEDSDKTINKRRVLFSLHNNQTVGMSKRTGEVKDGNARMTGKRKTAGRRTAMVMRTTIGERLMW